MQSGRLNRRISIEQQTSTQDAFGQPIETWTTVLKTWASIRAASGKEIYASSGFVSQLSHIITIRYRHGITIEAGCRVSYQGRIFTIQASSDPDEGRKQVDLLCLETNGGKQ